MFAYFFQILILLSTIFFALNCYAQTKIMTTKHAPLNNHSLVVISDVHFDPFAGCETQKKPCPLIKKLSGASATEWQTIFSKQPTLPMTIYKNNTNFTLLNSLQQELKTHNPQFVFVLGDLLESPFQQDYQQYSDDPNGIHYNQFAAKTIEFLGLLISQAFPKKPIFAALGNHDAGNFQKCHPLNYCFLSNDYFLTQYSRSWQYYLKSVAPQDWSQQFAKNGYYFIPATNSSIPNLIILNTTLFSPSVNPNQDAFANTEMHWLSQKLYLLKQQHQKTWILMHIPLHNNGFSTSGNHFKSPNFLWNKSTGNTFLTLLKKYSDTVTMIFNGHLHMDSAEIIKLTTHKNTAIIETGTPAISPIEGNNPGFKVYFYNPNNLQVTNFITYYLPINQHAPNWQLEYNFKDIYLKKNVGGNLLQGYENIYKKPNGHLARQYKQFYAVNAHH